MEYKKTEPRKAIELLSYIPARPEYSLWIKVISAISNEFDETTSLNILHTRFRDEKPNETLIKIKKRLPNISIATLVYYAKQHGYNADKNVINKRDGYFNSKAMINYDLIMKPYSEPKRQKLDLKFIKQSKPLFKPVNPELLPEFIKEVIEIYMNDGLSKIEATSLTIFDLKTIQKERAYYISVNKHVLNKNCNPKTKEPYQNYYELTNGFEPEILTVSELINVIGKGYTISTCFLKDNGNGKYIRKNENFLKSNCFAVDVDNGISLEKALTIPETRKALLIYTTCSHTETKNKFRIVFPIGATIGLNEKSAITELLEFYINLYGADKSCKDFARAYYGNNNTTIYDIQNGAILQFHKGS